MKELKKYVKVVFQGWLVLKIEVVFPDWLITREERYEQLFVFLSIAQKNKKEMEQIQSNRSVEFLHKPTRIMIVHFIKYRINPFN